MVSLKDFLQTFHCIEAYEIVVIFVFVFFLQNISHEKCFLKYGKLLLLLLLLKL